MANCTVEEKHIRVVMANCMEVGTRTPGEMCRAGAEGAKLAAKEE
jgi:hypothetical protein